MRQTNDIVAIGHRRRLQLRRCLVRIPAANEMMQIDGILIPSRERDSGAMAVG